MRKLCIFLLIGSLKSKIAPQEQMEENVDAQREGRKRLCFEEGSGAQRGVIKLSLCCTSK